MIRGLNSRHLLLIGASANRNSIRSGAGIIAILLIFLVGLLLAHVVISPVELGREISRRRGGSGDGIEDQKQFVETVVNQVRPMLIWAMGGPSPLAEEAPEPALERWIDYLVQERPALLSGVFLLLFNMLPIMLATGGFNQTTGDIATRGLRYLLPRTERANIYLGRYLGTVVYSLISLSLLVLIVVLYLGLKIRIYAWGDLLIWGAWAVVAYAIVSLPYVAFYSWMSGKLNSPFISFLVCVIGASVGPILSMFGRFGGTLEPLRHVSHLKYISPWGVQSYLFHPDAASVALGTAGCLAYAGIFLFLGLRSFSRRDL